MFNPTLNRWEWASAVQNFAACSSRTTPENDRANSTEAHRQEWLASAIDPEIIDLNVRSLCGDTPYEYLLYGLPQAERRNDGRVRDWVLKSYRHLEHGGWWCSGIDVLTGEATRWGCFKPDRPRSGKEIDKRKTVKYEHPPKVPTEIFALYVPDRIALKIATNAGKEEEWIFARAEGKDFWQWVIDTPSIQIALTEGAKKAGALLSAGYCAIALPGIFSGYRQAKDQNGYAIGMPKLIPQLEVFAVPGREFNFCFDRDSKPKTILNVRKAILKTGKLLAKKGCQISVTTWNYREKGVDDLIAARGDECFQSLYNSRQSLKDFELKAIVDLSPYVSLKVNQRYLSKELVAPADATIIGIKAPKGTGKTEWLTKQVAEAIDRGQRCLVMTHRIQLTKTLCRRFGLDHIEELRDSETGGIFGYGLCIDSLHPKSQAKFDPEEWQETLIFIDEAEQVIWHQLNSETCQKNRIPILNSFQQLLQLALGTGGKLYLSDADLSPISLQYVQQLIGYPVRTWVVENTYLPSEAVRDVYAYGGRDPSSLVAELLLAIDSGKSAIVHTSAQKASSKWGTINLESLIKSKFPNLKVLRIDSESVAEPGHPAMGCMANLNEILPLYDVVIASPTIETGISIDVKHFDSVWGIALGNQTVDAVCQTLERVRDDVPRHLWAAQYSRTRIGNGSTNVKGLLASQHKLTKLNISLLQQAGINDFDDLDSNCHSASLTAWAKRACVVNAGYASYRASILSKLKDEGYELIPVKDTEETESDRASVKEAVTNIVNADYDAHCHGVSDSNNPSDARLDELKEKRAKTREERLELQKGELVRRYGTEEITPEMVKLNDSGWYPKLRLHYYLTVGKVFLAERDRRSLGQMAEEGNGKVFKPDVNKRQLSARVKTLELLNIEQFFDERAEFTSSSLQDWFDRLLIWRHDIKTILGITISLKDTPIGAAKRLLDDLLGLKLDLIGKRGGRGQQKRVYRGCQIDPDDRQAIFERWRERDEGSQGGTGGHGGHGGQGGAILGHGSSTSPLSPPPSPLSVATPSNKYLSGECDYAA
jgi:hypothetical protein